MYPLISLKAFSKIFKSAPDDLDMHVIYDVSHNVAKVEEHVSFCNDLHPAKRFYIIKIIVVLFVSGVVITKIFAIISCIWEDKAYVAQK